MTYPRTSQNGQGHFDFYLDNFFSKKRLSQGYNLDLDIDI
jgi:hypothetical protein